MKSDWNNRWKKAFIWLSGYLSIIAFAVVGGYVVVKCEDKELRKTAKTAFIVTLLFTAIDVFMSLLSRINALAGYNLVFTNVISWINFVLFLAEIAIYVFAIVVVLFVGNAPSAPEKNEPAEQTAVEDKAPAEQPVAEEKKESAEEEKSETPSDEEAKGN